MTFLVFCIVLLFACVCVLGAFVAFICVRRPNLIFFTLHYITCRGRRNQTPRSGPAVLIMSLVSE